jgi:hypothetical protein
MPSFEDYERQLEWVRHIGASNPIPWSELNIPVRVENDKIVFLKVDEQEVRKRISDEYILSEVVFK